MLLFVVQINFYCHLIAQVSGFNSFHVSECTPVVDGVIVLSLKFNELTIMLLPNLAPYRYFVCVNICKLEGFSAALRALLNLLTRTTGGNAPSIPPLYNCHSEIFTVK